VDTPPILSRKIGPKNQLNLPSEYMAALGMSQGQQVYVALNPDRAGTLVVVPEAAMRSLLEVAWDLTAAGSSKTAPATARRATLDAEQSARHRRLKEASTSTKRRK
jgi:antitoxin component of MazEF toxin-antitoxin module